MTLPDERYRAMRCGYQFLMELCNPQATPKVPKAIRQRARSILRHYPGNYHFEMIAQALPNEFSKTNPFLLNLADDRATQNDSTEPEPPEAA